jgi:hypothetical protein
MNSNPSEQQKSSYAWIPLPVRIGLLLAAAVVIYLLVRSCNDNRLKLESSRLLMIRERDSLANVIKDVRDHLASIKIENDTLFEKLSNEEKYNRILLYEKINAQKQLRISNHTIKDQSEKISVLSEYNGSLLETIEDLQSRIDDLNRQIAQAENKAQVLDNTVTDLNESIKEKDQDLSKTVQTMAEQHLTDSARLYPVFVSAGEFESGLGINRTEVPYSQYFLGGSVLFGMEFNKRFLGGIGAGAHIFNGGTLMPLFLEFRYGFPIKSFTPYIFSKGGPLLDFGSYSHSNLFLNAGIGLRHQISEDLAFNFGTGIYSHNSRISGRDSFINFNIGIIYSNKQKTAR